MELTKVNQSQKILKSLIIIFIGSIALTISAKLKIPFYPVPMTMQTFVVLLLGISFGYKIGLATVSLYLLEGIIGMPVFSNSPEKGIGFSYMLGGTGGYLIGYVFAAGCCGWLAERGWGRNPLTTATAMLIGNVLIYVPGLLWLGSLYGWDKPILAWGFTPFVLGDLIKIALASCLMPVIWRCLKIYKP